MLGISSPAFPSQDPIWWQDAGPTRLKAAFARIDPLRARANYLEDLQTRIQAALTNQDTRPEVSASLYEELLYLRLYDRAQSDLSSGEGTFCTWPEGWNLQDSASRLVESWQVQDPRWNVPMMFIEDSLEISEIGKRVAFPGESTHAHLRWLQSRFGVESPKGLTIAASLYKAHRDQVGALAAAPEGREILRSCSWSDILASNIAAYLYLAHGEFQALYSEGRLHEARDHSIARYEQIQPILDSNPVLAAHYRRVVETTLINEQSEVENWRYCYNHALQSRDRTGPDQVDYNYCWVQLMGMSSLLHDAAIHPKGSTPAELAAAEEILDSTLRRTWPPLLQVLGGSQGEMARAFPEWAGSMLAQHSARSGDFRRGYDILREMESLPAEFLQTPGLAGLLRTRYQLLQGNGANPETRERAHALFGDRIQQALQGEAAIDSPKSGSSLLANNRLGSALDTQLLLEWRGVQAGPLSERSDGLAAHQSGLRDPCT
ncbi:MAG: hypothetical protein R3F33_03825 [Planctomycetota bacterium]